MNTDNFVTAGKFLFDQYNANKEMEPLPKHIHPESIEEAISLVLTDSKLRSDLEQKGIKQSSIFTWHKCCQQTLDVYNKVLQST